MSRKLKFKILRSNPYRPGDKACFGEYEVPENDSMTVFLALHYIREHYAPGLAFDFVCRAGICGSCGMMINGRPTLACKTMTRDLDENITLTPMPSFELIKDLSVNTGKWMEGMSKRVESWVHTTEVTDITAQEKKIEPETAQEVFELERCIECGCCVAACGAMLINDKYIGAVGVNRVARFDHDPHDERTDRDFFESIGDDDGIFGCMTMLGCQDTCPKNLPLQTKLAYIRRKLATLEK